MEGGGTRSRYEALPQSFVCHVKLIESDQICNFLNKMVDEIDLDSISPAANGTLVTFKSAHPTDFDPMRRKMRVIHA